MVKTRSIFLYPFALLYGLVTAVRNILYNTGAFKSTSFPIPVICVGNLAVGGTGKTPHTEYLAGLLSKEFKVAILSRGYKRKSKGFVLAHQQSTVFEIGDEPLQIARKLDNVIVAVDRNRADGIKTLLERFPDISVVILDDAFQHRKVEAGLSILLTDFRRLFLHDYMLPYGNLRESSSGMERADIILITRSPADISPIQRRLIVKEMNKAAYQNLYFTSVSYGTPKPVFEDVAGKLELAEAEKEGRMAILVTGIAHPEPFYDFLKPYFAIIEHIKFPDHHMFNAEDIESIYSAWNNSGQAEKCIITTEKDSVRIKEFSNFAEPFRSSLYYIPIGIEFLNNDKEEFDNLIVNYVRKNKRNNRIS